MKNYNFLPLRKNITDVIKESQMKLGFSKNDALLNYPAESLNNLLGENLTTDELSDVLEIFCDSVENDLGRIKISLKDGVFCFVIPEKGVSFINDNVPPEPFLSDFLKLLKSGKQVTISDILDVFHKYSNNVECIETDNDEFNYLVYFRDGVPDSYRYCIDIDFGFATYHRLTTSDFNSMGFDFG